MSAPFSRAQMLRRHHRYEEAVAMLMGHLAHFPDDAAAFVELALNRMEIPNSKRQALEDVNRAVGLMPGSAYPLALKARILCTLDREKEALGVADQSVALDPESAYNWNSRALALAEDSRWRESEEALRQALALDPDDTTASNLLAYVLRKQGRLKEAVGESMHRLSRDPENPHAFASAGWSALQGRQVREAEEFFREALRLDPDMEHARHGLKEAYRARSAFYRFFQQGAFYLTRFNVRHRRGIAIGLILGFHLLRWIAVAVHPLLIVPVVVIYYVLVCGSWLARGLANFLLLKDRVARLSLDTGEKVEGLVVGGLFFAGVLFSLPGFVLPFPPLAVLGPGLLLAAMPATLIFTNPSAKGRYVFAFCGAVILTLAAFAAMRAQNVPLDRLLDDDAVGSSVLLGVVVSAASSWLANLRSLRLAKAE